MLFLDLGGGVREGRGEKGSVNSYFYIVHICVGIYNKAMDVWYRWLDVGKALNSLISIASSVLVKCCSILSPNITLGALGLRNRYGRDVIIGLNSIFAFLLLCPNFSTILQIAINMMSMGGQSAQTETQTKIDCTTMRGMYIILYTNA